HLARCTAAFLGCVALVPATIMTAFALVGVWPHFRYWVFENNIVPGLRNHPAWWVCIFPLVFPVVICAGRVIIRTTPDCTLALRRGFIFLVCGFYIPALWSFWSLVTRQDYLPYHPLAFMMYAGAILTLSSRFITADKIIGRIFGRIPLVAFIAAGEFLAALLLHPFWFDGSRNETDLLRATLQLTEPGDFVIDEKGETVFRQRCFGPIWEPNVMERIRRGLMVDSAAERCIETRTCVAVLGKDISLEASRFIATNYLPVGNRLRVAGAWLRPLPNEEKHFEFDVVIPASYAITTRSGIITGKLDGEPYKGARFLAPGRHSFVQTSDEIELALLWAQAVDRHFTPFNYSHPSPDS
ncbi:MAG: hypothetical protein ACR2MF_08340, partial [Chthoniobacterales bacterium]